ncbi:MULTISPECIES: DUF308 domain-containing protein [unclassified Curtobacterium]|uniref:DUF308 domain-containing protein n=1 Tax=unclassified Curtobacterium TaxID=257496 RepID=UPI0021AC9ACA|nr:MULTISPECIES: DUF308 domain-containing protein [unclassified Curtobacterium]WIB63940.1 DUF308 domain-containing protein [Curtobacterium sp. MCBD17_040]
MSDTVDDAAQRARYWTVPLSRALPAAVVAMVITFSSNHATSLGLVLFGAFAIVEGALLGVGSLRRLDDPRSRRLAVVQAAVTVAAGVVALFLPSAGLPAFLAVVTAFAVVTGGIELLQGVLARRTSPFARDWMTVGGLTVLLAIAFLLTPPDYSKDLGGIEHVSGTLDSSIILVGLLGAYLALTAVFHVIAALSHKWGTSAPTPSAPNGAPHA